MIKNFQKNKKYILIPILSVILSVLLEFYVIFVENSSYFYTIPKTIILTEFLRFLSIKHVLLFLILFGLALYILFNNDLYKKLSEILYKYRFILAALVIVVAVLFELHGSSIAKLDISDMMHKSIFGIARNIRSDEFNVNTMFAFSQYYNNFNYFSAIPRAAPTDMFIVYGQPVWDFLILYRPFLIGYLFLSPAKGLSFFWISRLVILFLVSFEFGMLITKENRTLSLVYAFLLTFCPWIQWWFAINELVEMLIFGQLAIVLIKQYLTTDSYKKKLIHTLLFTLCFGGFILTLYPAWEIPLGYLFVILAIWIIYENKDSIKISIKDLALIALFLSILTVSFIHLYNMSWDTIVTVLNTSYPGGRVFTGGGQITKLGEYAANLIFPLFPEKSPDLVNNSFVFSFFPMGLILFYITQIRQKKRDLLTYLLFFLYVAFVVYYIGNWPELIAKVTLLGKSLNERLLEVATFIELLIVIRSISIMDKIKIKKQYLLIISLILTAAITLLLLYLEPKFYGGLKLALIPIILIPSFYMIFNLGDKKYYKSFLALIIIISFLCGGLVNPIESGCDVYFNQPIIQEVNSIVQENPNSTWIVEDGIFIGEVIGVGAPTVNCVNTYPNLELWSKLDPNNESYDIYNRYAHIVVHIINNNQTSFEPTDNDAIFTLNLNVNDLEKLNVTYILTLNELDGFSNDNVSFIKTYDNGMYNIYRVYYRN